MSHSRDLGSDDRTPTHDEVVHDRGRRAFLRSAGMAGISSGVLLSGSLPATLTGLGISALKSPADLRFDSRYGRVAVHSENAVTGPVGAIEPSTHSMTVGLDQDTATTVVVDRRAVLWRDQFVTIDGFEIGDVVVATGSWSG